jgi:hypothetical protein
MPYNKRWPDSPLGVDSRPLENKAEGTHDIIVIFLKPMHVTCKSTYGRVTLVIGISHSYVYAIHFGICNISAFKCGGLCYETLESPSHAILESRHFGSLHPYPLHFWLRPPLLKHVHEFPDWFRLSLSTFHVQNRDTNGMHLKWKCSLQVYNHASNHYFYLSFVLIMHIMFGYIISRLIDYPSWSSSWTVLQHWCELCMIAWCISLCLSLKPFSIW